jgi:hypothetical protein
MILAIILLAVFSSLCLAMVSMSSSNVRSADNHRKAGRALASAQSGLEVVRFAMSPVYMDGITQKVDRFGVLADFLAYDLASTNLSNVTVSYDGAGEAVSINLASSLNSEGQSFAATIQPTANIDVLQVDVTGTAGSLDRDIRVSYEFGTRMHNVFDFGVATKGPLNLLGNIELNGTNIAVEADVYIESANYDEALSIIGNSQIAGEVKITNPDGYADLQGGQAGIGGETGAAAHDHVEAGAPAAEFPVPMPGYFEQYVTGDTIDATTDTSVIASYDNVRIAGGTNPHFTADTTLRGIVFIETPNIVTFSGNVEIIGLIVGDGDVNDNSGTNQIIFQGTISSSAVTELPGDSQFDGLREETGTFLMAPGFSTSFGGNFDTLNGVIASNGVKFFGNAGGTIEGSVLNYSDTPMELSGNSDLFFNRSGVDEVPAGFGPEIIMHYMSSSYSEIAGN